MLHSRAQRVSDLFKNDKGRAEVVGKVGRDAGGDAGTTAPSRLRPRSGRWLEDCNQVRRVEPKRLRSSPSLRTLKGYRQLASSLHTTKRRYSRPEAHKEKSRTNNMQSVSMCVQDVAGPHVGSQKSSMSQTRHRRAGHATLAETKKKNRERRTQSSRCRKQQLSRTHVPFSKVGIEIVHEGTKRPSNSSAARRIPNISLSRGITHQDTTAKVNSAQA